MANLFESLLKLFTLSCLVLTLSGCSLFPLAVPAAVSGGAVGINYSLTNVASKTISHPVADVEAALHKALIKMRIKEVSREGARGTVNVTATTTHLDIYIDLEKVTPTVTSIKVNAKKGVFLKDKATATEIIVQTENSLELKE
jgi:hypothetical protein